MLDLGAFISVMSYYVYEFMDLEPLKNTNVMIQFIDRFHLYPFGVVEDVLVHIERLIFLMEFYINVIDECGALPISFLIFLERLFLKNVGIKIDVFVKSLTLKFDEEIIQFNIDDLIVEKSNISPLSKCVKQG